MIKSLQGLRAIAMISIFLFHAGLLPNGIFPVTLFFLLSGFFMYYKHNNISEELSIINSIKFGVNKIKKLYPMHIATFVASIFIRYSWIISYNIEEIILMGILNILLVQSLFSKYALIFNSLSWYLSTTLFCYILSPILIRVVKKVKINEVILISVIWGIQLIIVMIIPNYTKEYDYLLYISPYFRISDFLLGIILAKKYTKRNIKSNKNFTVIEVMIIISFIGIYLLSFILPSQYTRGVIFSPIFIIGIYYISYEGGILSQFLKNKLLINISKISFEFYMVHELVIGLLKKVLIFKNINWILRNILSAIIAFLISYIIAYICNYMKCRSYYKIDV